MKPWSVAACDTFNSSDRVDINRFRTMFSRRLRRYCTGFMSATCLKLFCKLRGLVRKRRHNASTPGGAPGLFATMRWHSETTKAAEALASACDELVASQYTSHSASNTT